MLMKSSPIVTSNGLLHCLSNKLSWSDLCSDYYAGQVINVRLGSVAYVTNQMLDALTFG